MQARSSAAPTRAATDGDALNLDPIFIDIVRAGGVSGALITGALLYLGLQVRALQKSVDRVQITIGEKVFPRLDDHTNRISALEGRYRMWEVMRGGEGK
jgi:hypothetical protein